MLAILSQLVKVWSRQPHMVEPEIEVVGSLTQDVEATAMAVGFRNYLIQGWQLPALRQK